MITNATARNFSSTVLDGTGRKIVQFHATWCGPCKQLAPHFEAASEKNDKVEWIRADVDELDPSTISDYSILSVPKVLVFENGQVVKEVKGRTVYKILEEVNG